MKVLWLVQAALQPELLGGEYTHLDYQRRPAHKDLGKRILYRDWYMTGWGYKTVTPNDLKVPVVYGEGKRVRFRNPLPEVILY